MCLDSLARDPLSALSQPMCYLAACDAACNWIDTPAPLGKGFSVFPAWQYRSIHIWPDNENINIHAISRMRKKKSKKEILKNLKKKKAVQL